MVHRYISIVAPKLRAVVAEDSAKKFLDLHDGWSHFMGLRGLLYPEILCCMVSSNALRCAKVALEGGAPLSYCSADPNGRHRYGFTPLHMAAETFSVDMLNLPFRYGASANIPTKGDRVIGNLLPLNVAVENASMHKYLEDHWDYGDPVHNLFLLCLPEMKMFLDTVRLIAKHTDNIVDMVSKYIDDKKLVEAAILLLASQKQLRDSPNKNTAEVYQNGLDVAKSHVGERLDTIHCEVLALVKEGKNGKALKMLKDEREKFLDAHASCSSVKKAGEALLTAHEVSLNGFDIVKGRIDDALDALHHEELAMVKEGKNGKVLKTLEDRKEVFLTAHALVGIVRKAGEALERYIQTHPQVPHAEIVEHVSSILNSNGVVHFGKGIDTGNLECYQYRGQTLNSKPGSQSVEGRTNEADKSSSLENEGSERILAKQPPRLATKDARNMFFPYWKSVLSARLQVKITPPSQPSRKGMQSTEPSGTFQLSFTSKSVEAPSWIPKHLLGRNNGSTRQFCAVASMSLKAFMHI